MTVPNADHCDERFTLCIDDAGRPVQRVVREMTAAEVLLALNWQAALVKRLQAPEAAALGLRLALALKNGDQTELDALPAAQIEQAAAALQAIGEAETRLSRLITQVRLAMPEWSGRGMRLAEAVRRYWPD